MSAYDLTVRSTQDRQIRVLTVAGDLDATTAARLSEDTACAVYGQVERFVWDLSGVTFLDCAGARALAEATRRVPDGCPVIVRSVSRPARHLLQLLELDLERLPRGADLTLTRRDAPAWQPDATWSRWQLVVLDIARVAVAVAETEENVAATLRSLARHKQPADAARLTLLSEQALHNAARNRRWLAFHGSPVPVSRSGRFSGP